MKKQQQQQKKTKRTSRKTNGLKPWDKYSDHMI